MFQGFSKETGELLWDLSFHNERPWFLAHKEQFERVLNEPFKALARDSAALLQERFPDMLIQCHISRIYRDARRLFGRGPYKDHLWFTIWDSAAGKEGPAFWFEVGAASYGYGMGFFEAPPAEMKPYRRAIDANPARFARLAEEIDGMGRYRIFGAAYARPKGSYDEPVRSWYERKYVGAEHVQDLEGDMFSPALPGILADAFTELMPMYRFLREVHLSARRDGLTRMGKESRHEG